MARTRGAVCSHTLAGIFLACVKIHKVAHPTRWSAAWWGKSETESGFPGVAHLRPSAQQKRDKSSTLIRILPLFALWNTILNGMGAQ